MAAAYFVTFFLLTIFLVDSCTESKAINGNLPVGARNKFKCPSKFGAFPDPDDCVYFHICWAGFGRRTRCPPFTAFDMHKRRCMDRRFAKCINDPSEEVTDPPEPVTHNPDDFQCPGMEGSYPHPRDCSKFYKCSSFNPELETCPEGELFDGVLNECRNSHDVHCGNRLRPDGYETTEAVETTSTEAPPETTTEEEVETTTRPTGPPDTDCDEDDLDCIITDTGEEPDWFDCPEDVGSYPHPSSRKLFIFCLNWKPSVKKCGQDLVFDDDYGTCVKNRDGTSSEEDGQ